MTTINQLAPAVSVADTDEIPIWQGGITRQATRAQLLAGVQPELALPAQTLLGRSSGGAGAPGPIAIGANLLLAGGTLAAEAAPFEIAGLVTGRPPAAADLVPLAQAGSNIAISYGDLMTGIAGIPNVSASGMVATASGTNRGRKLADILADSIPIEAFGAAGDGATDDTAAFNAALNAGRPLLLGSKTYVVNGQWTVFGDSVALLGVPGQTVIRRMIQTGNGAWIAIQSTAFYASGIIFDANRAGSPRIVGDFW